METATDISTLTYDKIIDLTSERFTKLAPASLRFDAEKGFAIQLLQTKPELMAAAIECPTSLRQAIINIATIGLSLNPAKREAYLITRNFKVSKNPDRYETRICLEPSYIGLCNLATNTGSVVWVQAKHVCENDVYENVGPDKSPNHSYNSFKDRGKVIGYYCVAKLHNGDYLTTEMSIDEINKVKSSSESGKRGFGPWVDWFDEQAKKTVVRRAFKMWPKSDQYRHLEEAVQLSNDNEGFEPILTSPVIDQYTAQQKDYFDQLITKSDAVAMFLFTKSIDETVFTNLYHSFEKGTKGKYQGIVDGLVSKGAASLNDLAEAIIERAIAEDDAGVLENIDGLAPEAIDYILGKCGTVESRFIRSLIPTGKLAND